MLAMDTANKKKSTAALTKSNNTPAKTVAAVASITNFEGGIKCQMDKNDGRNMHFFRSKSFFKTALNKSETKKKTQLRNVTRKSDGPMLQIQGIREAFDVERGKLFFESSLLFTAFCGLIIGSLDGKKATVSV